MSDTPNTPQPTKRGLGAPGAILPLQNQPLLPQLWESPEAAEAAFDAYCDKQIAAGCEPLITETAMTLGISARTFRGYLQDDGALSEGLSGEWLAMLKRVSSRVEAGWERELRYRNGHPASRIFGLKQHGWRDTDPAPSAGSGGGGLTVQITLRTEDGSTVDVAVRQRLRQG